MDSLLDAELKIEELQCMAAYGYHDTQEAAKAHSARLAAETRVAELEKSDSQWYEAFHRHMVRADNAEARIADAEHERDAAIQARDNWRAASDEKLDRIAELEAEIRGVIADLGDAEDEIQRQHKMLTASYVREKRLREALEATLDCKGPYSGTVSDSGGRTAVCFACEAKAREALVAGSKTAE
jgi:hypothetical protein